MGYLKLSEVCRIILHVEKDFLEDFCFKDVAKEMEKAKVFTTDECRSIQCELTEVEQTERMLFLLMYRKNKEVKVFQEVLLRDYDWLSERIAQAGSSNEIFEDYERCIRGSNIPNNRSGVIYRTDLLWQVRKALVHLRPCNYLILHGNTGSGKRWLAIDACCDYCIIRAMNYKIFWLNMTDCVKPEKILGQMERLKVMLLASLVEKDEKLDVDGQRNGYISMEAKIEAERNDLRKILRHESLRDCLVVLGDLCSDVAQNAFDLHCKVLVTTRNLCSMARVNEQKKVLLSTNAGFTESESFWLFEGTLGRSIQQSHLRGYVSDIRRIVNGNPDLMAKIAKNLLYIYDGNVERRLSEWIRCLGNGVENNRTKNVMDESLKVLDNEEAHLYRRLAIFPPNCMIPIPVLAQYFAMNFMDVEELVRKFERYSLLEIDDVETSSNGHQMMCRIHFICAQYLARSARDDLTGYHRDFVATYRIPEVLAARTEPNLLPFPHDHYFYTFIGYHLCEGELFDLFLHLFSDFGFLEVKVRESGLTNTLGDLKMYQEISNRGIPSYFMELQYFLPNVEERIYQAHNLTLLQQALGAPASIRELAREQIRRFPHKVWFRMNCSEKWLKIVQLCSNPSILRFVTPNSVLVAQKDHNIVQTDLSNNSKYIPNVFQGHEGEIIQMEVFAKSYLISLDANSVMYVWYIGKDYRRRSENGNSTNRRQFAGHFNYNIKDANKFEPLQKIPISGKDHVVCFHTFYDGKGHKLLCALDTADVMTYNWSGNQFVASPRENFTAKEKVRRPERIKCLQYIGSMKVLVLVTEGKLHCFSLQDHASVGFTQRPLEGKEVPIAIHFNLKKKLIYCVFAWKIVQIKIVKCTKFAFLKIKFIREIYHAVTAIECSALAKNGKFLVLGTKTGIIVFDCERRVEVQQNYVAEHVACIDVVTSREIIVIFGSDCKRNIANIFEIKVQSQMPVVLQKYPFEVLYSEKAPTLYAVDTKKRLHEYNVQDLGDTVRVTEKNWTTRPVQSITAMTSSTECVFIGCNDGRVFRGRDSNWTEVTRAPSSVDFLKFINGVLVVGINTAFQVLNQPWHSQGLANCYAIDAKHLLAITKGLSIKILDMDSNEVITELDGSAEANFVFCDFASPFLLTCANRQPMSLYRVIGASGEIVKLRNLSRKSDAVPSSVAVSTGKDFLAIGFQNGAINLYNIEANFRHQHTLESHKGAVTHLAFSPWAGASQILISLGEQMCFWGVLVQQQMRYVEDDAAHGLIEATNRLSIGNKMNPWDGKCGASEKPELLSCIKFAGNSAAKVIRDGDFVKFLTIDNEGEIYVLSLSDSSPSLR
uniref:APAF-1 helical domain-containing protein n=1 Tax=Lutzomyia longipalpis TaxID=7200 RepID=A0A1B0CU03_LUTLO